MLIRQAITSNIYNAVTVEVLAFNPSNIYKKNRFLLLVLKRQFSQPDEVCLWLLNQEDNDVELIIRLIAELKKDLCDFKLLIENKGNLPKIVRVKKTALPLN